jgi:uracil-DNA glycosylase
VSGGPHAGYPPAPVPARPSMRSLRASLECCRACDLWEHTTQPVLGAVAAQGLLGPQVRIGRDRGRPFDSELAELVTITAHPSSILRFPEQAEREQAMAALVADLAAVADWLSKH